MRSSIRGLSRATYNTVTYRKTTTLHQKNWTTCRSVISNTPKAVIQAQNAPFSSSQAQSTSDVAENTAGYKPSKVPNSYVSAGLNSIEPVGNIIEATETKAEFELVEEFDSGVDQIRFFYEDKSESVPSDLTSLGFKGKQGQIYTFIEDSSDVSSRIVAVGLGKTSEHCRVDTFRSTIKSVYTELKQRNIKVVGISLSDFYENIVFSENDGWEAEAGNEVACLAVPNMLRLMLQTLLVQDFDVEFFKQVDKKSNDGENGDEKFRLGKIVINTTMPEKDGSTKQMAAVVTGHASAVASGQNLAKALTQLPANICNTDFMKEEMVKLKDRYSGKFDDEQLKLTILNEQEMLDLGMGCLTAVGRGSDTDSYLVALEYKHKDSVSEKPVVLVGKGVVHDSGGLNIKLASMDSMNKDMGGSASVIGTMRAVLDLELPTHVIGAIGLVENSVSHRAYRPGDVLKSMKGTTVEVGNTDAEGRLVLADVLYWAGKTYEPRVMLDMATLTGAILVSLGLDLAGCFSNSPKLAQQLEVSGLRAFDRIHKMPLYPPYKEKMKSTVADMNNIGGPEGGSITAALFLQEFVDDFRKEFKTEWAHLDIAGAAMSGKTSKDLATGRCVPLLVQFLLEDFVANSKKCKQNK